MSINTLKELLEIRWSRLDHYEDALVAKGIDPNTDADFCRRRESCFQDADDLENYSPRKY